MSGRSLPLRTPVSLLQDIKDSWDERHARSADLTYRIGEAQSALMVSAWSEKMPITEKTRREADRYLSALYRLDEARTERDASRLGALNTASVVSGATGNVWASIASTCGSALAMIVSAPRTLRLWRLARFSKRHPELRELDVTVNSRPATRREVIDARAAAHVKAAGHADPSDFSRSISDLYGLDSPPSSRLSPKHAAYRRDFRLLVVNARHAAREAYLNNGEELYLSYPELDGWQGAKHNSTTRDPSLGGKG